ncbi:MAG: RNase adapter RapZ [Micavibrio sp.]
MNSTSVTATQPPIIVTGLSGAGMSSVLKTLEDMGYEVFDNFPLSLIDPLIHESGADGTPIAIGIDSRTRGFDPEAVMTAVENLQAKLVFLVCDEMVLQKRFTETRRRHPVAKDRPVSAGIKREQEWLHPLRANADLVIDTTELSIHDLRHLLEKQFTVARAERLTVTLMSFGFRFGVPRDADLVMDVRFLANPHWVKELRPLTGQDEAVGTYVSGDPDFEPFLERFRALVDPLLPRYAHEGKSYLTIAVGCTGGRHRSVYTVERLAPHLRELGFGTSIIHRDVARSH